MYQFSDVSSRYGAPMGRHSSLPENPTAPVKVRLERMRLTDGDYDNGGAYWGSGTLYVAHSESVEIVVRVDGASDPRAAAKAKVREYLPNVKFFR